MNVFLLLPSRGLVERQWGRGDDGVVGLRVLGQTLGGLPKCVPWAVKATWWHPEEVDLGSRIPCWPRPVFKQMCPPAQGPRSGTEEEDFRACPLPVPFFRPTYPSLLAEQAAF